MNDQMTHTQVESSSRKARRIVISVGISAVMFFFGYAITVAGYRVVREWSLIGPTYAGIGVLWLIAGPAMFGAGLWILGSLGRHRIALRIAGTAAAIAAVVLILGVLSNIVPCSGPS
ncbi:MAG TPA: hypothetical protein VE398_19175 [Acidobacteriota bacterium]|nr:hypothetical protein [Acidobacteriota bacterium]